MKRKDIFEFDSPLFAIDGFAETWERWGKFRSEIHKPLTETQIESHLEFLATQEYPIETIKKSINSRWQGLFPLKDFEKPIDELTQYFIKHWGDSFKFTEYSKQVFQQLVKVFGKENVIDGIEYIAVKGEGKNIQHLHNLLSKRAEIKKTKEIARSFEREEEMKKSEINSVPICDETAGIILDLREKMFPKEIERNQQEIRKQFEERFLRN